jgi:cell wall-associated NlpC family hydrolase
VSTAPLDLKSLTLNGQDAGKHHADLAGAITEVTVRQTVTGASTVDVTLADAKRTLVTSAALTTRSRIVLDGAGYALVSVAKNGARVSLTFEDDAVAELRTHAGSRKAAAGTTTRAGFVTALIREVPDLRVVVAPGSSRNLVELSRGSGSTVRSAATRAKEDREDTWTAAGRIMGEIGWRVYCYRGTVYVAPDSWLIAHNGKPFVLSPDSKGVHDIDFQWDTGKPSATATITADAGFRDFAPGSPITLQKLGPANGSWLVETIERSTYSKKVTVSAIRPQPVLPEPKEASDGGNFGIPAYLPDYLGDASAGSTIDNSFRLAPTGATGIGALTQVTSEQFVRIAYEQRGKPYVYGARGPNAWDCAGFTYWCAKQVGVNFPNPVAAQAALCRRKGTTMSVSQAAYTRGAVIWHEYGGGPNDHIVISLGDGQHTIEAMGTAYGVVVGKIQGRAKPWTGAGYVPGIPVNVPTLRDLRPG